jgi:hypothetical protein
MIPNRDPTIPSKEKAMNRFTLFRRHAGARRAAIARPVLEPLEDRTVLSTLTVLNALDSGAGSLRDTIKAARSGDTIQFDSSLSGQTITLTSGELAIAKSLNIEGPGAGLLAISGDYASRVFDISQNQKPVAVTIAGLTIENGLSAGSEGGGIFINSSTLTLINDVLSNNEAVGVGHSENGGEVHGGAIANFNGTTLIIRGCAFNGNEALGTDGGGRALGGAIFNHGSTATITDSTFSGNIAQGGNGGTATSGNPRIGLGEGGAIANDIRSTLTLASSTFTGNEAIGGSNGTVGASAIAVGTGGGGGLFNDAVATVTGCTLTGNKALGGNGNTSGSSALRVGDGIGGGIVTNPFMDAAVSTSVSGCTFTGNQAIGGAGNTGGVLPGDGIGGGFASYGSVTTATVTGSTFTGNCATGGAGGAGQNGNAGLGGGIANFRGSSLIVSDCTLTGNSATGGAGGAGQDGGDGLGGGLYNDGTSTLTVTLSTATGNSAIGGAAGSGGSAGQGVGGGAYFADGGIVCLDFFTETNITGNTASTRNNDIFGSFTIC